MPRDRKVTSFPFLSWSHSCIAIRYLETNVKTQSQDFRFMLSTYCRCKWPPFSEAGGVSGIWQSCLSNAVEKYWRRVILCGNNSTLVLEVTLSSQAIPTGWPMISWSSILSSAIFGTFSANWRHSDEHVLHLMQTSWSDLCLTTMEKSNVSRHCMSYMPRYCKLSRIPIECSNNLHMRYFILSMSTRHVYALLSDNLV